MAFSIKQSLNKGIAAHKKGNLEEAEKDYREILKYETMHADANHNLGVLLNSINKTEEALTLFLKAVESNPSFEQFWLSYINLLIKLERYNLASQEIEKGRKLCLTEEKAKSLLERINSNNLNTPSPTKQEIQSLTASYEYKKYDLALKQAEVIINEFPEHQFTWRVLGAAYGQIGKTDEALKANKKALELNPKDAVALSNLGVNFKDLNRYEEATAALTESIALSPNYEKSYFNLGLVMQSQGKEKLARENFAKAASLNPNFAEAKHMVASLDGEIINFAPREYVESMFDGYAQNFEQSLVGELKYESPRILANIIRDYEKNSLGHILDLGCGTGLVGEEIKLSCNRLVGVDVSNQMLKKAEQKSLYDELFHQDITAFLASNSLEFNYFIMADVLVYIGDLSQIFELIKKRNQTGGTFVFTTEDTNKANFFLEKSGRFSHSKKYIESLCKEFGYQIKHYEIRPLRLEFGKFISGGYYLLEF